MIKKAIEEPIFPIDLDNPYEILKLEHQLCFRLYQASRNMTRLYTPLLEQYGLTYPQYIILLVLFEKTQIDFKELSQIVDLKTGTLTPIIQKLEEMHFLTKESNPKDKRKVNVSLTQKGQNLKETIVNVPKKMADLIQLTENDYILLIEKLDQLTHQLNLAENNL